MIDSISNNLVFLFPSESLVEKSPQDQRPTLVLHVGLPKTASTTLQNRLFKRINNINYLGRPFSIKDPKEIEKKKAKDYETFLKNPAHQNFLYFFFDTPPSQYSLETLDLLMDAKKVNLISNETLCRDIFRHYKDERLDNIEELSKKYNLKIVLTLRKQQSLMPSQHLYLRSKFKLPSIPLEQGIFFTDKIDSKKQVEKKFLAAHQKDKSYLITDKSFNFLHIYESLKKFVPKENFLVMPIEGILSNDFSYRRDLFRFITQRNPNIKEKEALETFHLYKANASPFPGYHKQIAHFQNEGYANRIFEIYKKSNEKLAQLLGFNLKPFGYY